jgi:hypothetical protein
MADWSASSWRAAGAAGERARHLDAGRLVPLLVELISEDNGGGPERAE